jgi:hypothetical protein
MCLMVLAKRIVRYSNTFLSSAVAAAPHYEWRWG